MKPYTMDSPSPGPLPSSLVVKKGSMTRLTMAAGMPEPLSVIATLTGDNYRDTITNSTAGGIGGGDDDVLIGNTEMGLAPADVHPMG
ncbi:hypothetical protein IFT47_26600 [Pseudomonas sp. CFBP 13711]|jgi:hypothetical protein|nr:hypothetical protein [Pseudomonas sp. CFBP 13711]MBD8715497.1 hypothetical protein [Pseudomonas sp. CFBP 13715]